MNNETETRDELIERIAELADQFACGAAGEPVVYALHGPTDFAEEVIELVTAARDADAAVPEPDAAAIERVAKAIAEMYPPRESKHDGYVKPVWDMADIEDLAEHVLKAAARKGTNDV